MTEIKDLTEAVDSLIQELEDQRSKVRTQGLALIAQGVVLIISLALTVGFIYVYNVQTATRDEQRLTRTEALCPLYFVFLDSYSQQRRDSLPPTEQQNYDNAFVTIRHGSEVLGCKR